MQNIRHPLHFCIFCAIYRFVMKQKSTWQLQFSRCFVRSNGNSSTIVCNIPYNSASGIKKNNFCQFSNALFRILATWWNKTLKNQFHEKFLKIFPIEIDYIEFVGNKSNNTYTYDIEISNCSRLLHTRLVGKSEFPRRSRSPWNSSIVLLNFYVVTRSTTTYLRNH